MPEIPPPELLSHDEFVQAIAETLAAKLSVINTPHPETEIITTNHYPRYPKIIFARQIISIIAIILTIYALLNIFYPVFETIPLNISFFFSLLTIIFGFLLIICLISEVFQGAGTDVEHCIKQGEKKFWEYNYIPSLNRFTYVLLLLALIFWTIILGFASFYTELLRQNPEHFFGLQDGFLAIYFSIVTFSTVGYGDIHPASFLARITAICEIFIAMFFSLVVISTTLSWVVAHKRQEHEITIKQRIQDQKKNILNG